MESIDEPSGLNWTGLVFPISDPNAKYRTY